MRSSQEKKANSYAQVQVSEAALAPLSWALEKHLTVLGDSDPALREPAAKILELLSSIQPKDIT